MSLNKDSESIVCYLDIFSKNFKTINLPLWLFQVRPVAAQGPWSDFEMWNTAKENMEASEILKGLASFGHSFSKLSII